MQYESRAYPPDSSLSTRVSWKVGTSPLLHTKVDESPSQTAGLSSCQVKKLLPDVLQELLWDEQFGTSQGAIRVFGFS
ncbi:hypothetical protein INR49_005632 [Caranx melampygus]|nr:hypothetical protein INR49_005632 [Caranx melampygus]